VQPPFLPPCREQWQDPTWPSAILPLCPRTCCRGVPVRGGGAPPDGGGHIHLHVHALGHLQGPGLLRHLHTRRRPGQGAPFISEPHPPSCACARPGESGAQSGLILQMTGRTGLMRVLRMCIPCHYPKGWPLAARQTQCAERRGWVEGFARPKLRCKERHVRKEVASNRWPGPGELESALRPVLRPRHFPCTWLLAPGPPTVTPLDSGETAGLGLAGLGRARAGRCPAPSLAAPGG